ncbi:hypothetical protein HYV86_01690 [Candidatus Woesearchaeota archaeon]|nr:hypothetical protein [Candidatus Woesearchaeota archaeon]
MGQHSLANNPLINYQPLQARLSHIDDVATYARKMGVVDSHILDTHLAAVVISAGEIKSGLSQLATALTLDYQKRGISDLVMVNVLDGATPTYDVLQGFLKPNFAITPDTIKATRYGSKLVGEDVELVQEARVNVRGKHVLLVEDLVDEGATAHWLLEHYAAQQPASLRMVSLAQKPGKCQYQLTTGAYDYHAAIDVGHHWLVGFGMDLSFKVETEEHVLYRNLPFVAATRPAFLRSVNKLDEIGEKRLQALLKAD